MNKAKVVRTTYRTQGNQYGTATKNSAKERKYGVELDGIVYGRDLILTRNGAKLAAALIDLGYDIDLVINSNCDDCIVVDGRKFDVAESVSRWVVWYD